MSEVSAEVQQQDQAARSLIETVSVFTIDADAARRSSDFMTRAAAPPPHAVKPRRGGLVHAAAPASIEADESADANAWSSF